MRKILIATLALCAVTVAQAQQKPEFGALGLDTAAMDKAVKPGDDFFAYMNGGWVKTNTIPADRSSWGDVARLREQSLAWVHDILQGASSNPGSVDAKKYGDLYASYMDEAAVEAKGFSPIKPDLARIAAIKTPADLARAMGELQKKQPPFGFGAPQPSFPVHASIDVNLRDPTKYIAEVSQGGLGVPDRDYYLSTDPKMAAARDAYRAYLVRLFELTGMSTPAARADRVIALETAIAKTHWTRVETRDTVKTFNLMSPAALAKSAPGFDWPTYLATVGFAKQTMMEVDEPSAMTGFAKLAKAMPMQTWRDYLSARVISNAAPLMSSPFVTANFDYFGKALAGTPEMQMRWKRAVAQTNVSMGDAIGREYAAKYFPPEAKAKIEAMIGELKAAYARRIDGLDWMAAPTKVRAKTKLANLKIEVGTPDHWRDYSKLTIVRGDLLGSVQRANAFEYNRNLAKLGQPVDRSAWSFSTTPQTVNAFNSGALIKLEFPAGFLSPPYFDPAADAAVNYGAIGTVIGHEISHSFDDQGAKLDEKGRLITWWTPADTKAFEAAVGRLAAQYDAYEPLPGVHLQGRLQLGENVGDLGGLASALDAYHHSLGGKPAPVIDGLTGDQRFFLAYSQAHRGVLREATLRQLIATDPHSPDPYRAANVRNIDAWYDAFGVKPGDKLYLAPADRVRIW